MKGGKAPCSSCVAEKSAPRWARLSSGGHPLTQSAGLVTVLTTPRPTATYRLPSFSPRICATCLSIYLPSVGRDSHRGAKKDTKNCITESSNRRNLTSVKKKKNRSGIVFLFFHSREERNIKINSGPRLKWVLQLYLSHTHTDGLSQTTVCVCVCVHVPVGKANSLAAAQPLS